MLKRSRSESSDYAIVTQSSMPLVTKKSKANQRGLYKKKRYYRRGESSLTSQLNRLQNDVHNIVMSGTWSLPINGVTGFATASPSTSMSIVFNESSVLYSLGGGTFQTGAALQNSASYAAVFDQWRLNKVVIQVLFSSNTSQVNQATQFPIMYCVTDTNDFSPLNTVANAVTYGNCKILQMGTSSGPTGGIQMLYLPNPTVEEEALTTAGTVLTAAGRRSPWLNTDNPSIQHNAIKIFVDTPGGTNTTSGYVTFIARCFFSFKNII